MDHPATNSDEVKRYVAGFVGVPVHNLKDDTSLLHDLGMDGDDAHDFMQEFARRFHVDLAQFVFKDYFAAEAASNPLALVRGLLDAISGADRSSSFRRLEIRHLVQAAMTGSFARPG